jgi:hypothetical protein
MTTWSVPMTTLEAAALPWMTIDSVQMVSATCLKSTAWVEGIGTVSSDYFRLTRVMSSQEIGGDSIPEGFLCYSPHSGVWRVDWKDGSVFNGLA